MAKEGFPLPRSSYDELVKIIEAYDVFNEPKGPADVASAAAMNPTELSRNNRFLVAIGVIEGGKKKIITEQGRALASALQYDIEGDVRDLWRAVADNSEFLQKVLSAVRIRKGMELTSLQSHVAYSAGQTKTKKVLTGAGAVVEILKAAGLLQEEDGKLVAIGEEVSVDLGPPDREAPKREGALVRKPEGVGETREVTIQIQIQCSPDDLDSLAPKLRNLLREISRPLDLDETESSD